MLRRPIELWRRAAWRFGGADLRRLCFIACVPKSGSTFLMRLMREITGFDQVHPITLGGPNEQDFDPRELPRVRHRDGVCHQHVKATENNLRLAAEHRLRVVVLVRNIFDVVVSLNDHFHRLYPYSVTGVLPDGFFDMPREQQWMLIIRLHLPWYFNFLISWERAERAGAVPMRWASYEEIIAEPIATARELLAFWGVATSEERVEAAVRSMADKPTKLNRGVPGRGSALGAAHRRAIHELASACPLAEATRRRVGLADAETMGRVA